MQVEVSIELSESDEALEVPQPGPGAPVAQQRPLQSFLAAVNSADSVFSVVCAQAGPQGKSGPTELAEFGGRVDLVFAHDPLNSESARFAAVAYSLHELLSHDPSEASHVRIAVRRCQFRNPDRLGHAFSLWLAAQGTSAMQAELRWGIGLARLQQALMFLSRVIRHEQAHPA